MHTRNVQIVEHDIRVLVTFADADQSGFRQGEVPSLVSAIHDQKAELQCTGLNSRGRRGRERRIVVVHLLQGQLGYFTDCASAGAGMAPA